MMREVLALTGKAVFLDSSKNHVRFAQLSRIPGVDLRPIFLARDGRAAAHSMRRHGDTDYRGAAHAWVRFNTDALRMVAASGRTPLLVRYEDLCVQPSETLARIHRFLGLEPEPWPPRNGLPTYHVLGNEMRHGFNGSIRVDQGWQTEVKSDERVLFERIAGDFNRRLGYTSEPA
jgi:hypothetical protein